MADRYDEQLFLAYVEGTLPIAERIDFEKRMVDDPRLRSLVVQLVLDRHYLRQLPAEEPPAGLTEGIDLHLERAMLLDPAAPVEDRAAATRSVTLRRVGVYAALAAMVALSVLLIVNAITPEHQFSPEDLVAMQGDTPDDADAPPRVADRGAAPDVDDAAGLSDPSLGATPPTRLADGRNSEQPTARPTPDRGLRLDFDHFAWTAWPSLMPAADSLSPLHIEVASTQPLETQQRLLNWAQQRRVVAVADHNDPLQVLARRMDESEAAVAPGNKPSDITHATPGSVIEVFTVETSASGQVTVIVPVEDVDRLLADLNQPSYQTARLTHDWQAQLAMWRATAPKQVMRIPVIIRPATAATLERIMGSRPINGD